MSARTSSTATTSTRKPRGSAAVTAAAASGSSGRPKGSGRASGRSTTQATAAKGTAEGKRKVVEPRKDLAAQARKPRAVKNAKVADLPPKGVTPCGAPTRSKAQSKRGAKEGTAVKNLEPLDAVAQVTKSVSIALPSNSQRRNNPKPKSRTRAGKTKSASRDVQPPNQTLLQVQTTPVAAASRQPIGSPVAIAATTRNSELLGPIERHVGLDIGKITEFCEVRQEQVTKRVSVRNEEDLEQVLGPDTDRARVVLEACREAWYLHDLLTGWGHEVWVVDTTRVRQLGIGQHKRKNDRIDAECLARGAESGKVPRAHVLSHASQRLRMQLGVRRALVETRAQYTVSIRSMLRSEGLQVPSCDVEAFLKKLNAVAIPPAVRDVIKPLIAALEALGPQIDKVDEQLEERCDRQPAVRLLISAPGVGRIVAAAFISVIDNPGRFRNAHEVEAYLGLVPSESTSGKRKLGSITKQGNAYLRAMLVQAAWNVLRQRASDPVKSWGMALSQKRGKRVAAVAIARRLAGILWAMWRNNSSYDRSKVGQSSARGKRQEATRTEQAATTIEVAAMSAT